MRTRLDGIVVRLEQESDSVCSRGVLLRVTQREKAALALKLRVPVGSSRTRVSLNGKRLVTPEAGCCLKMERRWEKGDLIEIVLDFSVHCWVGQKEWAGSVSPCRGRLLAYDRRFNAADPVELPALDATRLRQRHARERYAIPLFMLLEFEATGGRKLRLCDYVSGGEADSPYKSLIRVENAHGSPQYFATVWSGSAR